MKPSKRFKLVYVLWLDSRGASPRWQFLDDTELEATLCHSVGYLVQNGKDAKRIAPHIIEDQDGEIQINGDMVIPNTAIVKMKIIFSSCLGVGSALTRRGT